MPLAFSYLRMSRPEQLRGDSLRRQLEASRAYAAAHGLTLDESMQDLGISAFRGKNRTEGTLAAFIEAIQGGRVPSGSVLIVENLDRLSREQVSTALNLFLTITGAGVTIVTLSDGQTYSKEGVDRDFTKLLMSIVYMARAHDESAMKSSRLAEAWKAKRARALADPTAKLTGRTPAWLSLTADRKGFRVMEDRAAIVRRIFQECAAGIGAASIARRLNEDGIRPFGRSGRGWHPSSVKKILDSESVIGTFQPHVKKDGKRVSEGAAIPAYFPSIIEEGLFHTARAALTSRRTGASGQKGRTYGNLFAGLLRCGSCGGPMHLIDKGSPPKGGRYVQCDRARRRVKEDGRLRCEEKRLHHYVTLENFVLACLPDLNIRQVLDLENETVAALRTELSQVEARLGGAQAKMKRLVALAEAAATEDEDEVDDALAGRVLELRTEISTLRRQRKELERRIPVTQAEAEADDREAMMEALGHMQRLQEIEDPAERYRARAAFTQDLKRIVASITIDRGSAAITTHSGEEVHLVRQHPVRTAGEGCFDQAA